MSGKLLGFKQPQISCAHLRRRNEQFYIVLRSEPFKIDHIGHNITQGFRSNGLS